MDKEVIDLLLEAPDTQLDASMKPLIKKWSIPPTPLQILEVLDYCINASLASGFTVSLLQFMYKTSCDLHNTKHEDVIKNATWRDEL